MTESSSSLQRSSIGPLEISGQPLELRRLPAGGVAAVGERAARRLSGQPGSPFYANLAESFGRGEYFPLSFSRAAVDRNAAYTLVLVPR